MVKKAITAVTKTNIVKKDPSSEQSQDDGDSDVDAKETKDVKPVAKPAATKPPTTAAKSATTGPDSDSDSESESESSEEGKSPAPAVKKIQSATPPTSTDNAKKTGNVVAPKKPALVSKPPADDSESDTDSSSSDEEIKATEPKSAQPPSPKTVVKKADDSKPKDSAAAALPKPIVK